MAKKEFTYRGLTAEQLKKLSLKEFAALLPSRERRTLLRGYTDAEKSTMRKLDKRASVKTQSRELVIVPSMIGKTVMVHTGKEYVPVAVTEEMMGFRLGEFVLTRKMVKHNAPGIGSSATTKSVSVK